MGRIAADSSVFHAIADPTRRAILDLLREEMLAGREEGRRTVMAMLGRVSDGAEGITQSGFSQHLKVLLNAGLVKVRRRGRTRVYSLRPRPLTEIAGWVAAYDVFWSSKLDNLGRYLEAKHADTRKRE